MMNVLNLFGNTSSLIIKVIKSFSLILEDEGFPESLRAKLDEVINKENKKTDKTPKFRRLRKTMHPCMFNQVHGIYNIMFFLSISQCLSIVSIIFSRKEVCILISFTFINLNSF